METKTILGWLLALGSYTALLLAASDSIQRYLYDDVARRLWLRVLIVSVPMAALLTYWPVPFIDDFEAWIVGGLLHSVLWWPLLLFVLQYHWPHALALALLSGLLGAPMVNMGLSSILGFS